MTTIEGIFLTIGWSIHYQPNTLNGVHVDIIKRRDILHDNRLAFIKITENELFMASMLGYVAQSTIGKNRWYMKDIDFEPEEIRNRLMEFLEKE